MFLVVYVFLLMKVVGVAVGMPTGTNSNNFSVHSRQEWQARDPVARPTLTTPVPYVVIHHSHTPPACNTSEECRRAMRSMQNFHMDDRNWWDIGYNFAVGGDGAAYEGRGWSVLGAHALHFNDVSIGICLIGDWSTQLPPKDQLQTAQALIEAGVKLGYIRPEYKLVGHRQVRATECPGQTLFQEIQHWPHYSSYPATAEDIKTAKESV